MNSLQRHSLSCRCSVIIAVKSSIDELLENSAAYAAGFAGPSTHVPSKPVAIVTCMDARMNGFRIFGLEPDDARVFHNAGGLVTDGVLRCLVISQRLLATREVMLVHHTECGLHGRVEVRRQLKL
jgi:carbonic anhydrase